MTRFIVSADVEAARQRMPHAIGSSFPVKLRGSERSRLVSGGAFLVEVDALGEVRVIGPAIEEASATPPLLDHVNRLPRLKREWVGLRFAATEVVSTGTMTAPVGSLWTIRSTMPGRVGMDSEPCELCGVSHYMTTLVHARSLCIGGFQLLGRARPWRPDPPPGRPLVETLQTWVPKL